MEISESKPSARNEEENPVGQRRSTSACSAEMWQDLEDILDPLIPQDPRRAYLAGLLRSACAEGVLGSIILLNLILIVVETNHTANGDSAPEWMVTLNYCFFSFYCVEMLAKLWVLQWIFPMDPANVLDAMVVLVDVIMITIDQLAEHGSSGGTFFHVVRVFRIAKLLRAIRVMRQIDELNLLVLSFLAAAKSIFWGMVIVGVMISVWSVIAVQVIHPINQEIWEGREQECSRCAHAFESVQMSSLTIFQTVIAGDSWGQLAVPIVEKSFSTMLFFSGVLVTISLGMLNLILAVVVEAAADAKQEDFHHKSLMQEKQMLEAKRRLLRMCRQLDADGTGTLTIDEFMAGFDNSQEFADMLRSMDITKEDMATVFSVLDEDGSGDVQAVEFVERLHGLKSQQGQQILFNVLEIRKMMTGASLGPESQSPTKSYSVQPSAEHGAREARHQGAVDDILIKLNNSSHGQADNTLASLQSQIKLELQSLESSLLLAFKAHAEHIASSVAMPRSERSFGVCAETERGEGGGDSAMVEVLAQKLPVLASKRILTQATSESRCKNGSSVTKGDCYQGVDGDQVRAI